MSNLLPAVETLSEEQIAQVVSDMQSRLDRCSQAGQAYRMRWRDVKLIIKAIRTLQDRLAFEKKWHGDHEEREAAVCPEDVPCDEYIRHLQSRLAQVEKERDELKWALTKRAERQP